MTVIFETVHGSRLYGLAHEQSDHDLFRVTTSKARKARHYKNGDEDICEVGISLFLERAQSGSHQSVEALFSPFKHWSDESYRPVIESTVVAGGGVYAKYERTIRKFCYGDFKRRRHACRLAINLHYLRRYRRFNPCMTSTEITLANAYAARFEGDELAQHI